MHIITLFLFLTSLNVSAQTLFSSQDYNKELKINIITNLKKIFDDLRYTNGGAVRFQDLAKPYRGYIQFLDDKNKVIKQIPALFMSRGGYQRTNLRMILPASKRGKEMYLKGSIFEDLKLSSIKPEELSIEKYKELKSHIDKKKIFINKDGKIKFIKMINFDEQISTLLEFTSYRISELFLPEFYFKTRLFKATYYNCDIKSFKNKIFNPKQEKCELFITQYDDRRIEYKDYYGFFIEPTKSARKRAGLKKYKPNTDQELFSKLDTKHIIKNIAVSSSPFGSADWSVGPYGRNAALGYNKNNNRVLIARYDFNQAQHYQSKSKCQLDKYAYLPKDILHGTHGENLLEYASKKNETEYFRSIEDFIQELIQKENLLIKIAIEHDKRESNLLKTQRNEMQVCVNNYIQDLKKLINPQHQLKIKNEIKRFAAFYDNIRLNAKRENIKDWYKYKWDEVDELLPAMKNNAVFDFPKYWSGYNYDESIHRHGKFTYKNKEYEFKIWRNGEIKIYAPSE